MTFKDKVNSGETLIGTFTRTPTAAMCEVLGRTEFDLVCLDTEHAPLDRKDVDTALLAFRSVSMPCIVRVPANRGEYILNALDSGANGILAPHIMNGTDARKLATKCVFGEGRGYAGATRATGFGERSMAEHKTLGNAEVAVIGQIEDAEALDHLDDILSVDGIDCFFVGRSDLTLSMGYDTPNTPDVIRTVEDICKAAQAKGRRVGTFTANLDELPHWRDLGVSLFLLGSEHGLLQRGAADFLKSVKAKL